MGLQNYSASAAQRGAPEPVIKCTPLLVDGVLYITIPDHVWALDARTGKELWHYDWVDHGGHLDRPARRRHLEDHGLFPNAGQLAHRPQRHYRQRAVEEELCRRAQAIFLDLGAADREEPCASSVSAATRWICPASSIHSIRRPAICNGPGGPRRARAIRRSRPGPTKRRPNMAAA